LLALEDFQLHLGQNFFRRLNPDYYFNELRLNAIRRKVKGYDEKGAREFCQKLVKDGWKIIIYTSRHWADYELIEKWCQKNKIPVRRIICGKPLFRCIIDDRCMEFTGDFNELYRRIGESKTAKPSRFLARQR